MHYYQFNIADYRKDTMHLSRLEHGIYRDLIDWYYLDESPIPLETQSVARRLRLDTEVEKTALQNVLSDFFHRSERGFMHHRIEFEIAEYHSQCEKNRENGKKGGRPKGKKTQSVSSGLPDGSQSEPTRNPNITLTTNQEPLTNNHISTSDDFDTFYQAYPKKVARPAAQKAYKSAKINGHLPELLADIEKRLANGSWSDTKFIPNPATYLNQRRWEDQQTEVNAPNPMFAGMLR